MTGAKHITRQQFGEIGGDKLAHFKIRTYPEKYLVIL